MRKEDKKPAFKKSKNVKKIAPVVIAIGFVLALSLIAGRFLFPKPTEEESKVDQGESVPTITQTETVETVDPTEETVKKGTGFISSLAAKVTYTDEAGTPLGTLIRGSQVDYETTPDGKTKIFLDGEIAYLPAEATVVSDVLCVIPTHTLYVRTSVNLRNAEGKLLDSFAEKGSALTVVGYDRLSEDGCAHMYRVLLGENEGYVMPWYLADTEADALLNYDNGSYATHAARENRYGGGGAANLDYFPREKGPIEGNEMPEECRSLYLVSWHLKDVDRYLELAKNSSINTFVVDIVDGGSVGYAGDVMKKNCPSAASAASNSVAEYQAGIRKIKEAGFYVVGRITTFNDSYFVKDHPELAITDPNGSPLKLSGEYWPTAFNRATWQYKVDLAVEAVKLMGFQEIQFDYVRFPDRTNNYESAGTIDFHNVYGETKAQAIQRFLMYATDILHENGVYVSADVYGESAYTYVTGYGQYWAAISNVVDVISGMPYPDHFAASGSWRPWEHPYETLNRWGQSVMARQKETATPAKVRTWIQAYNAIREPYNTYGPNEIAAQIKGLRDAGCTGGFMTWNAVSSYDKYQSLMPGFTLPQTPTKESET